MNIKKIVMSKEELEEVEKQVMEEARKKGQQVPEEEWGKVVAQDFIEECGEISEEAWKSIKVVKDDN